MKDQLEHLTDRILYIDCIEGMKLIPTASIDLILCDLPYGITARNKWDSQIDLAALWKEYERIIEPHGAIVLFGSGIFSADVMQAGRKMHRYNLVWEKTTPTGFLNARRQPLRSHEDLLVFYKAQPTYNPQKTGGHKRKVSTAAHHVNARRSMVYEDVAPTSYDSTERYPTSVLKFKTDRQKSAIHPTQKPLALCRWIIRTYTNPGDVVLDNACGSGTTCEAAKMEGRHYIGMDNGKCEDKASPYFGKTWAEISRDRVAGKLKGAKP